MGHNFMAESQFMHISYQGYNWGGGQYGCWLSLSQQPAPPSIFPRSVLVFSASYPSNGYSQFWFLFPECSPLPTGSLVHSGQGLPRGHQQSLSPIQGGELSLLAVLFFQGGARKIMPTPLQSPRACLWSSGISWRELENRYSGSCK